MDIDAYSAAHKNQWERLEELVGRRKLNGAEADELVLLYRACAQHLSQIRTAAPDPQVVGELSSLLTRARGQITGTRETRWQDFQNFVIVTMPAALYKIRWWSVGVTVAAILVAVTVGMWTYHTPSAMSALGSPSELDHYANEAFEAYYSTYHPAEFTAQLWTNNARIAVICVASGITGVIPLQLLWANSVNVGQAGAIMADHGLLAQFFALILPHGLLELSSVFIAGAAGLRMCWAMLVPGPQSRTSALAKEGRVLITVAVALTITLGISGIIEAFVTPAQMPWALKITIGALATVALWVYTIALGQRAQTLALTGDLDEDEAGYTLAEAG